MPSRAESLVLSVNPRDAVADAMMVAQAKHINSALNGGYYLPIATEQNMSDAIDYSSKFGCVSSSLLVLKRLTMKHPNLFDDKALIAANNTHEFMHHALFLIHGNDDMWYAGSPANNTSKLKRLSMLYEDSDLNVVMDMIARDEGGKWPSSETIMEIVRDKRNAFNPRRIYEFKEIMA